MSTVTVAKNVGTGKCLCILFLSRQKFLTIYWIK
jgi:hypothetical protein